MIIEKLITDGKLTGSEADKRKFKELGSWEKNREICTKGLDEMMRRKLNDVLELSNSSNTQILSQNDKSTTYEDCWKNKVLSRD